MLLKRIVDFVTLAILWALCVYFLHKPYNPQVELPHISVLLSTPHKTTSLASHELFINQLETDRAYSGCILCRYLKPITKYPGSDDIPFFVHDSAYSSQVNYRDIGNYTVECTVTFANPSNKPVNTAHYTYLCCKNDDQSRLVACDEKGLSDKIAPSGCSVSAKNVLPFEETLELKERDWVGIDSMYWLYSIRTCDNSSHCRSIKLTSNGHSGSLEVWEICSKLTLQPGEKKKIKFLIFAGPKEVGILRNAGQFFPKIDYTIRLGALSLFIKPLAEILDQVANWIFEPGLLGHALLLLAVCARILVAVLIPGSSDVHKPDSSGLNRAVIIIPLLQSFIMIASSSLLSGLIEMRFESMLWMQELGSPDLSNALGLLCDALPNILSISSVMYIIAASFEQIVECLDKGTIFARSKFAMHFIIVVIAQYMSALFFLLILAFMTINCVLNCMRLVWGRLIRKQ